MSQKPPTQERLQEIRDTDAMSGEDLQFCPAAWRDRRELLLHIDTQAQTIAELTADRDNLAGHVVDVYNWQESQGASIPFRIVKQPPGPVHPTACCANESRNGNGGCDSCGAPCL